MIVVENRIAELINLIPEVQPGFKPVYHYGEGKELNAFLLGRQKDGSSLYPLVYQTSYRSTQNSQRGEVSTRWEAIIATSTKRELYNTQREATTYQNILNPVFDRVDEVFRKGGIMRSEWGWGVEFWPNYSETKQMEKHGFTDVVDALFISCDLIITNKCIEKVLFKN